ncbi:anaerobic ribonucleoside-triphosphate reductase activating protein [Martelella alba]|uniref:Anaerobic ribonucleoside-triphosphate reductase activating protein n=1 Tax=Martelella alba TaxID=2590451 RepID=A0A506U2L5_9HYPH|nr:anaerobic ribonucleoside-triphosphate reductase activating protein [Martelella alba]TPW28040.1 anaerobic ribonucleoside-triphosphate reductase activating protein [Martelella alba]
MTDGRSAADLRIGGFERISFCDWPGQIAATVFLQGCPWRCPYCHNPGLLPAGRAGALEWRDILAFLETRRGLLDGVVFSGGEPTAQAGLDVAIQDVRLLGFRIGLHTAGPYPDRLKRLLPLVDWVGLDIKAPFGNYEAITQVPRSGEKAHSSLMALLASGVDYELRTTVHSGLLDTAQTARIAEELAALGAQPTRIQPYRETGVDKAVMASALLEPGLHRVT